MNVRLGLVHRDPCMRSKAFGLDLLVCENKWEICNQSRCDWNHMVYHSSESLEFQLWIGSFAIMLKHDWGALGRLKFGTNITLMQRKNRVCLFDTKRTMVIKKREREKVCVSISCAPVGLEKKAHSWALVCLKVQLTDVQGHITWEIFKKGKILGPVGSMPSETLATGPKYLSVF